MEVVSETIRDEAKTLPMEIVGSDEGAICSPLLSNFPQSPKTREMLNRIRVWLNARHYPLPKGSDSGIPTWR
jgi:nitrous oxide reductase accessory protein NosL